MFKRIAAIALIFACTTVAWIVLGSTVLARTYSRSGYLKEKVASNWGGPQAQRSPQACYRTIEREKTVSTDAAGKPETKYADRVRFHPVTLESSRVSANLHLDYRQKGLLWYSTYGVYFRGKYTFRNESAGHELLIRFPLPSEQAIYDDVTFLVNGQAAKYTAERKELQANAVVSPGDAVTVEVAYKSQGLDTWTYQFNDSVAQVRDFDLRVTTDFDGVDFPEGTLSPTARRDREYSWTYKNLMTGQQVRIAMPDRLQPGPVAGEISFFAPVSLLFFFFVLFIVTTLRRIDLHPMNYFFLAAAFFAFHLLFAYMVDHFSLLTSFLVASAVSVFLVVSYLRLVVNARFAAIEAGGAQMLYLVLFSYAFFFEGFTGLAITVGAILTLFVTMQLTARVRWNQTFREIIEART